MLARTTTRINIISFSSFYLLLLTSQFFYIS